MSVAAISFEPDACIQLPACYRTARCGEVPCHPSLPIPTSGEAIDRLSNAFGFTLRIRTGDHRAQLNVGDGAVILIEAARGISLKSAGHDPGGRCQCPLRARSPKWRAHGPGAADYFYGERQYNAEDFAGHHLVFFAFHCRCRSERLGWNAGLSINGRHIALPARPRCLSSRPPW